ncbi:DUF1203 domain-containing protein [Oxalobacteraceae sp. CFBP 8763]|nr:DUF1203 domain-containing protein [Oxalobacteraceae sp. CFBP 8763]
MNFRITGLSPAEFKHLFDLSESELAAMAIKRYVVDKKPGFPDRIALTDVEIGQTVLLLNHVSQPAVNPYRASHAIFVREGATHAYDAVNQIPDSLRIRFLSLRAYDSNDMMIDAEVVQGTSVEQVILKLLANDDVRYIHVHNAKQGCYAARIDRA